MRRIRIGVAAHQVTGNRLNPRDLRARNALRHAFVILFGHPLVIRIGEEPRFGFDRAEDCTEVTVETRGIANPAAQVRATGSRESEISLPARLSRAHAAGRRCWRVGDALRTVRGMNPGSGLGLVRWPEWLHATLSRSSRPSAFGQMTLGLVATGVFDVVQ